MVFAVMALIISTYVRFSFSKQFLVDSKRGAHCDDCILIHFCSFLQRECTMFGRQYSDDEDEEQYVYGHTRSELMGTKLAKEESSTRSRSEPIKKLLKAAPRVIDTLTGNIHHLHQLFYKPPAISVLYLSATLYHAL